MGFSCWSKGPVRAMQIKESKAQNGQPSAQTWVQTKLSVSYQCDLLQKVTRKEISLAELQTSSSRIKQRSALKGAFIRLTNVESWEEATEKSPHFANDDQLKKFSDIDIRKAILKTFTDCGCHFVCRRVPLSPPNMEACFWYCRSFVRVECVGTKRYV